MLISPLFRIFCFFIWWIEIFVVSLQSKRTVFLSFALKIKK